ncbi:MAG: hypothetical protein K2K63_12765 [Acetatifactor sp.]|nr:hypothetical protein [Acetatifactor sp.]
MNKEFLEQFILKIEELKEKSDRNAVVYDSFGRYNKVVYIENVIIETRELIKHGEKRIALENMLENINEVGIALDIDTITLAQKAFGKNISPYIEELLRVMTCK